MIDLFPGMNFNLRGSALRMDTSTPLGPEQGDDRVPRPRPEERHARKSAQTRINHHNSIWGPFGRNLHEDLLGVQGQGPTMRPSAPKSRCILHGRQENQTIHDENGMRHYYAEWGKWMNRLPSNPEMPFDAPAIAAE